MGTYLIAHGLWKYYVPFGVTAKYLHIGASYPFPISFFKQRAFLRRVAYHREWKGLP
jgi:hypothetical protein